MTETMACRGPDAAGIWIDRHAALGHRRLAVIDLPGGTQPMTVAHADGDVALVYSGEVYNFTELREELTQRGPAVHDVQDTEVVLRGYLEWGEARRRAAQRHVRLRDLGRADAELVMVRDRMGIKPLYYYPTPRRRAVRLGAQGDPGQPAGQAGRRRRRAARAARVRQDARARVWTGMHEVEPGTVVTVDERGVRERTYWRLETERTPTTRTRPSRRCASCSTTSSAASSSPTCRAACCSPAAWTPARSPRWPRANCERRARCAASRSTSSARPRTSSPTRCATPRTRRTCTTWPSMSAPSTPTSCSTTTTLADPDVRRTVVTARDLPIGLGDMDASLYLLFKAIREQSTVALSGESADEVFGGYR